MRLLLFIATGFLLFSTACIREINLSTASSGNAGVLVVDGDFTDTYGPHRLTLSRPSPYGQSVFEPVRDATVLLFDDQGNEAAYLPRYDAENDRYFYELPALAFQGIQGRAYRLEITLSDGNRYRSEPQTMPGRVDADTILLEGKTITKVSTADVVIEQKTAVVQLRTSIPNDGRPYFLRWDAHSVYFFIELQKPGSIPPPRHTCYPTDYFNAQKIVAQDARGSNGQTIVKEIGSKIVDFSFESSQYFTVIQRSIGQQAYEYWTRIGKVADPQGSVFDPPPAPVPGNLININNPADQPLGFFEVAAVDTIRRKVFNGELGLNYFIAPYCAFSQTYFGLANDPACLDCLLLKNSTYKKPHYWK